MFGPSFDIYRRNVLDPMRREKVDNYEFFTLCSLVLWDHGLEGQADDCVVMARSNRERILREVLFYYRRVKQINDPSMRLANLLVLLPALQVLKSMSFSEIRPFFCSEVSPEVPGRCGNHSRLQCLLCGGNFLRTCQWPTIRQLLPTSHFHCSCK